MLPVCNRLSPLRVLGRSLIWPSGPIFGWSRFCGQFVDLCYLLSDLSGFLLIRCLLRGFSGRSLPTVCLTSGTTDRLADFPAFPLMRTSATNMSAHSALILSYSSSSSKRLLFTLAGLQENAFSFLPPQTLINPRSLRKHYHCRQLPRSVSV